VLPFGQVAAQEAHLVHRGERAHHAALGIEDPEEDARGLRILAKALVDEVEIGAHEPPCRAREWRVVGLRGRERREQA
jgi:hypothetical protein